MRHVLKNLRQLLQPRRRNRRQSWNGVERVENRTLLTGILVNTDSNAIDAPDLSSIAALQSNAGGDGISLQEAVVAANNDPGADTIEFDASLLGSTILLTGTRMTISDDLTIDGDIDNDGLADITIDGAQSTGVTRQHFEITAGTTTLDGLNLSRGRGQGSNNGGIDVRAGATLNFTNSQLVDGFSFSGVSGIDNAGATNIRNSQINGHFNYIYGNGTSGIRNQSGATLNIVNSSLTGNSTLGTAGYTAEQAGIVNYGTAQLVNVTIADGDSFRGHVGFSNKSGATATLTHTTISGNQSALGSQSAGIRNETGATLTLTNSLVTGNSDFASGTTTPANLNNQGTLNLVGGNIIGDEYSVDGVVQSSGFDPGDVIDGSATDNGGVVETVLLTGNLANPALEAATVLTETAVGLDVDGDGTIESTPISIDARGLSRDVDIDGSGTTPDLGALELQSLPPVFVGDLSDGTETVIVLENTSSTTDSPAGTVVIDVDANDGDGGATDVGLTFALVSGNDDPDGDGNFAFAIDSSTGVITVNDETDLNLHRQSSFILLVSVTDTGIDHISSTATVVVEIADVSESYVVTTTDLESYDGGTLEDESSDGAGLSLSEAIALANAGSAADLIEFDASLLGSTILLTGTRMTISEDLTIDGDINNDGLADITIDGAQSTGVTRQHFEITSGTTTLYGLNLTRGRGRVSNNGGIDVRAGATLNFTNSQLINGFSYSGVSGIDNAGTTNIRNSQINGHFNYIYGYGTSGIRNQAGATLSIVNSSLTGNSSRPTAGYTAQQAGIVNYGTAQLVNVTIADGYSFRGHVGFSNKSGATATLTHTTISGNQSGLGSQSAGIRNESGATLTLTNSLVIGNSDIASGSATPANLNNQGTLNLVGGNIIGDEYSVDGVVQSSGFEPGDVIDGPAADNGGLVETVALTSSTTNPAIDAADDSAGVATDSRGFSRFDNPDIANNGGNIADLGAYEAGESPSLFVTTDLDVVDTHDGLTSLREALALANDVAAGNNGDGDADNDGSSVDQITFHPSLEGSTLTLTQGILLINSDVSIDGDIDGDGTPGITIDGAGNSGILFMDSGTSQLRGLTLTGGASFYGPGIQLENDASLTLINSQVTNNTAQGRGGGIHVRPDAQLHVVDSSISNNHSGRGGGIFNSGTLTVVGSTISNNMGGSQGGGIASYGVNGFPNPSTYIRDSVISGNNGGQGGGVFFQGSATLSGVQILNNTGGNGAGIFSSGGLYLSESTLSGNTASGFGGGLNHNRGSLFVTNTTIEGNRAYAAAGIYFRTTATGNITSSTITGNYATGYTGGIESLGANSFSISNSIVAGNSHPASVPSYIPRDLWGSQGSGAGTNLVGQDIPYTVADIFAEVDPVTGGGLLADNGGQVQTVALKASFDNPAFNTTDPAFLPADTLDLDGDGDTTEPVPFDGRGSGFARNNGGFADLGAYELPSALIVTTDQDVVDATDGLLSLREALALANDATAGAAEDGDADNDGSSVDHITFHPSLAGSTLTLTQGQLVINSDVAIDGDLNDDDAPDISVDAAGNSRVLLVSGGTSEVDGMIVTGGNVANTFGGGIFVSNGASLTIANSEITNNAAGRGGGGLGVYFGTQAQVVNSVVSDNSTGASGGGIYNLGTLNVTGSSIVNNSAHSSGGGIASSFSGATATVTDSVISQNMSSSGGGGGIQNSYGSRLEVLNSSILNNTARFLGGGLGNGTGGSMASLSGVTVSGNSTSLRGGGISNEGVLTVTGATLSGNTATLQGGGLVNDNPAVLTNVTIVGNQAGISGGGIQTYRGLQLSSSTVTGNYATSNGGVYHANSNGLSSISNSILAGNSDVDSQTDPTANPDLNGPENAGAGTNLIGHGSGYALGDIFAEVDPVTGGGLLADNGGQVQTVALKASYDNPAFNTADPAFLPADTLDLDGDGDTTEPIPFDARGTGFSRNIGGFADLGAYELPPGVDIFVSSTTGTEAGMTVITVMVTADGAVSGDQTVKVAVTGTGITADDYNLSNITITILNGQTTGFVTFTIQDDAEVEGTETATLTISAPSAGVILGPNSSDSVTIIDNDDVIPPTFEAPRHLGAAKHTNANDVSWFIQFSESVTGVEATDFELNFTPGGLSLTDAGDTDESTYLLTATSVPEGTLQINQMIALSGVTDLSGNTVVQNRQGINGDHRYKVDRAAPTPVISSGYVLNSGSAVVPMTVEFGEPVFNFDSGDLVVGNATVSDFATTNLQTYTFNLTPGAGAVTVDIPAAAANDPAGNDSNAATQFAIVNADITRVNPTPTTAASVDFDVIFSQPVNPASVDATDFVVMTTGSAGADVTVEVGDAGDLNDATYVVTVTSVSRHGTVGLDFNPATDIAGVGAILTQTVDEVYDIINDAHGILSKLDRTPGNVTAIVSGSNLVVTGDVGDNGISISSDALGNVVVAGVGGTTINGAADFTAFSGVDGELPGNLTVSGTGGRDLISVANVTVTGSLVIFGGNDQDAIDLINVDVTLDLKVFEENGDGFIDITDSEITGVGLVYGGAGNNGIVVQTSTFQSVFSYNGGTGIDALSMNTTTVVGTTQIVTRAGSDQVSLTDTVHGGQLIFFGAEGADVITGTNVEVTARVYVDTAAGNDIVDFVDLHARSTAILLVGTDNDAVRFLNSQFVGVANMPISAGNNVVDLQGTTFDSAAYIQATGGALGVRIRSNTFNAAVSLTGGPGATDTLLDDGSSTFASAATVSGFENFVTNPLDTLFGEDFEDLLGLLFS